MRRGQGGYVAPMLGVALPLGTRPGADQDRESAGYELRGDPQRYFAQVLFARLGCLAGRRGEIPPVRRKLLDGTMGGLGRVRARPGTWRGLHGYA